MYKNILYLIITIILFNLCYVNEGIPLSTEGNFIIDENGRVVILRGVNVMNKRSPYIPSIVEEDVKIIKNMGFNSVRFGIFWIALEPKPGDFNIEYLKKVDGIINLFEKYNIFVILDMHQDLYSEKYNGDGAPFWACLDDDIPYHPAEFWSFNYFTRAVKRAFDNFWNNAKIYDQTGVQDHFIEVWKKVAIYYKDKDIVIGYDLFNEPFYGSYGYVTPTFDQNYLQPFYERLISAMQKEVPNKLYLYEPNVSSDFGYPSFIGPMNFPNLVFYFHNYCISPPQEGQPFCNQQEALTIKVAWERVLKNNTAWAMGEFGAVDEIRTIKNVTEKADDYMLGWHYWAYMVDYDPTGTLDEHLFYEDGKEKPKVNILSRTYPQKISGIPQSFKFYPETKIFSMKYIPKSNIKAPTEIFIPKKRHYSQGIIIDVKGGKWTFDENKEIMLIYNDEKSSIVEVNIRPKLR